MKNILKACLNWKALVGIGTVILLAYLFVPNIASYTWILFILVCPLSMIFMMKAMNHGQGKGEKVFACTECGMSYKEVEWANKCAAWCKEHHGSCNVEITKHSVK